MRFRAALLLAPLLLAPTPVVAQGKLIDVTVEILDRFFKAREKENSELKNVEPSLAEQDAKIKKFQECKRNWEMAGEASGHKVGGLAARIAIKAKCGSSDDGGMIKDRQKILDGPENAAAKEGGWKVADYRNLRDHLQGYLGGDYSPFTKPSLDVIKPREKQLAALFGMSAPVAAGAGMPGMRGAGMWTPDFTWTYIYGVFAMQFLSGATMFESDYKPGDWTRWQATQEGDDDKQVSERAFIGKPSDGGEWWRTKTIYMSGDQADTITLEMLFKPQSGNDLSQTLVRMRGKLPGNTEPQELIVPEQYSMWNMAGSLGRRPTKESIEGATIGTESVTTPAGTFRAKHLRFGGGDGTLEWWVDETAVGGWVKFAMIGNDKKPKYEQVLIAKGTGAKSELGVTIK